jgi:hypothetical protein
MIITTPLPEALLKAGYTQDQVDAVFNEPKATTEKEYRGALAWLRDWLLQGGYPGYRNALAKIDDVLK